MAGTIFFSSGARWTDSSSIFALALEALIPMISDLETHEIVVALNEGNVGMLDVEDLPPRGRTEVLQILADGRHWESAKAMITGGQEWIDAIEKPMARLSALAAVAMREGSDDSSAVTESAPGTTRTGWHRKTCAGVGPTLFNRGSSRG